MASPTQWTWVWAISGSWWWTGKPDVLQSLGSQRVGHDLVTEQQQYSIVCIYHILFIYPSVDRYLGCFHLLATINNATMNIGIQHISCFLISPWLIKDKREQEAKIWTMNFNWGIQCQILSFRSFKLYEN